MKKLFLLVAALICTPAHADPKDIRPALIIGGAVVLLGGVYLYSRSQNTPANNAPEQTNVADSNNITPASIAINKIREERHEQIVQHLTDLNKPKNIADYIPNIEEKRIESKQKDKLHKFFMNERNVEILYGC